MSRTITFKILCLLLFKFCEPVPILPIITAIAGTGTNLLSVDIDTLGIAKWMSESTKSKKNRSGFVKDLMYTAFYKSEQKYNVLVFNLNEEHKHKLEGIQFFGSAEYSDGTKFGIWVFEYGFFINQGARGWDNWAMIGTFQKNKPGNIVTFRKRLPNNTNKIKDLLDLNNIFCDIKD